MSGLLTPAERDRARSLTTVLTGVLAAGSVAAVGAVSAVAAEQTRQVREAREAQSRERTAAVLDATTRARAGALLADAAGHPRVVLVPRPTRTVVDPGVVLRASAPGTARPGPASAAGPSGSSRSSRSSGTSGASGASGTSGASGSSAARPAPAPAVVAPVVPSTGS